MNLKKPNSSVVALPGSTLLLTSRHLDISIYVDRNCSCKSVTTSTAPLSKSVAYGPNVSSSLTILSSWLIRAIFSTTMNWILTVAKIRKNSASFVNMSTIHRLIYHCQTFSSNLADLYSVGMEVPISFSADLSEMGHAERTRFRLFI